MDELALELEPAAAAIAEVSARLEVGGGRRRGRRMVEDVAGIALVEVGGELGRGRRSGGGDRRELGARGGGGLEHFARKGLGPVYRVRARAERIEVLALWHGRRGQPPPGL